MFMRDEIKNTDCNTYLFEVISVCFYVDRMLQLNAFTNVTYDNQIIFFKISNPGSTKEVPT